jgi:hypothetical protein
MQNAVEQVETKNQAETVAKPASATADLGGSCLVCASGVNPTVLGGDYTDALQDGL